MKLPVYCLEWRARNSEVFLCAFRFNSIRFADLQQLLTLALLEMQYRDRCLRLHFRTSLIFFTMALLDNRAKS